MSRYFLDFLEDIYDAIIKTKEFTAGLEYHQFINDTKTLYAIRSSLQMIGEAANQLPKNIKDSHPDIPWKKIIAFRNRLVHKYFGLDVKIVWEIIQKDLPTLEPQIKKLIEIYKNNDPN